jgi:hypothetical protein
MTETAPTAPISPSRKKLLLGTGGAIAIAAVGLVVFVLPAEYGIDPTGAGAALGLTQLSDGGEENIYLKRGQARSNVLFPLETAPDQSRVVVNDIFAEKGVTLPAGAQLASDRFQIELLPYEGIELKYVLDEGAPMWFWWYADGPVNVDMHSHPFAGGTEATESFVIADLRNQSAVYVAPFNGIHGWYWQNRTMQPVKLTLDAVGLMSGSKIFDPAGEHDRPLSPPSAEGVAQDPAPAP